MPSTFLDLKETGRELFSVEQFCSIWEWLIVVDVSRHCVTTASQGFLAGRLGACALFVGQDYSNGCPQDYGKDEVS